MITYRPAHTGERGAILILSLIFGATLAALAFSSFATTESTLALARQDADALRAELAAQSGMTYGRMRLLLDADWDGTDGGVEFIEGSTFSCEAGATPGGSSGSVDLEVTGESGDGYRALASRIAPNGGSFEGDVALALLGGDDYLTGVGIVGDVLVTDAMNAVYDWVYDEDEVGAYQLRGPDSIEGSDFHCSWINGTIYKFTNTDYAGWPADEVVLDTEHLMPQWDLDGYLPENGASSSDYEFITNKNKIQNKTYYKPVVVINPEGKNFYVKNCNLYGGIVVWCPKEWDPREDGARQTLKIKDSIIGGLCGGDNIGILAPGCELHQISGNEGGCGQSYSSLTFGFSMVQQVKDLRNYYHDGMLYVIDRVKKARSTDFVYDSYVYENLPPGIELENDMSGYTIASMGEDLD